jgi:hypothetical protein
MKKMKFCLLAMALFFGPFLYGQDSTDNIESDRPDETESPAIVKKGYFQGEIGFTYVNTVGRNYTLLLPESLLRYGLSKRVELRLALNYRKDYIHLIPDPVELQGVEPVEAGVKIGLLEEKKARPQTSLIAHIGFSEIASAVYKPKEPIASIIFAMEHTLSRKTSLGYNLGLKWEGESSSPVFAYTFAPGFNLTDRFYLFVESYGFIGKENFHDHNVDAGLAYLLTKDMQIDFGMGKGLSKESSDHFFTVGFSFRLPVSKNAR